MDSPKPAMKPKGRKKPAVKDARVTQQQPDQPVDSDETKEVPIPFWKKTKVPAAVRIREAAVKQKGPKPDMLHQKLKEFWKERRRYDFSLPVTLTVPETGKTLSIQGLLDCGSQSTCIDKEYAVAQDLPMKELDVHILPRNADGTLNLKGEITHYVDLMLKIGSHQEVQRFLVTGLGKARLFLGYDWLLKHNPSVDWRRHKITFTGCPEECNTKGNESATGF
jgi:hypothetical protein